MTVTVPEVGRSRPATMLAKLVLPEPDGPVTATVSLRATDKDTFSSASTRSPPLSKARVTADKTTADSASAFRCSNSVSSGRSWAGHDFQLSVTYLAQPPQIRLCPRNLGLQ